MKKAVKFLHYDLILNVDAQEQERFNVFNWSAFEHGERVYLDENEIGFFERMDEDTVYICIQ